MGTHDFYMSTCCDVHVHPGDCTYLEQDILSEQLIIARTRQIHWALVNVVSTTSNDDNTFYCFSASEAALYHPADVPTWKCEFAAEYPLVQCAHSVSVCRRRCSEAAGAPCQKKLCRSGTLFRGVRTAEQAVVVRDTLVASTKLVFMLYSTAARPAQNILDKPIVLET